MAQLLRVIPRTTSLLSSLPRSSISISSFHSLSSYSSSSSSLSSFSPLEIITPSQSSKEISHVPIFDEEVVQFGKYDYGDDEEKVSKVC